MKHRNRKSTVAAAAALGALALALSACGASNAGSSKVSVPTGAFDVQKDSALADKVPARIKDRGTLVAAAEAGYAPFDYYAPDDANTIIGIDPDLARAIATKLGLKLDMVNTSFDTIIPGINTDKYDLGMSNHDITTTREKVVDMVAYLTGGVSILVPQAANDDLQSLEDVCGKTAGISKGEIYAETLDEQSKKCEAEGKAKVNVSVFPSADAVVLALTNNKIDFTLNDTAAAEYRSNNAGKGKFRVSGRPFGDIDHGIVLRKGSEMTALVAQALQQLIDDGTYMKILEKWGLQGIPVAKAAVNPPAK